MAVIHYTATVTPSKVELVAAWLPGQPWYLGGGSPDLSRAGGFRLDDPADVVGIEFMVITDRSGAEVVSYHVPVTYRGEPLEGADSALIGTTEHSVLGQRWVYDGEHDAVLLEQLLELLRGSAEPQMQSKSNTPDPSVLVQPAGATEVSLATVRLQRVLEPIGGAEGVAPIAPPGSVTAGWNLPDGSAVRGLLVISNLGNDRPA